VLLVHVATDLTVIRAGLLYCTNRTRYVFTASLFLCFIASAISLTLSWARFTLHKTTGASARSGRYRQLLRRLIATSTISLSAQLGGAILVMLVRDGPAGVSASGNLYRGVVLVLSQLASTVYPNLRQTCTFLQLLCCFALYQGTFERWFWLEASQTNEASPRDNQEIRQPCSRGLETLRTSLPTQQITC
jgi:hypothetical protein